MRELMLRHPGFAGEGAEAGGRLMQPEQDTKTGDGVGALVQEAASGPGVQEWQPPEAAAA